MLTSSRISPRQQLRCFDEPMNYLIPAIEPRRSQGDEFPFSPIPAVNVASVPQRSPLRYPGGKTWLIPHIRAWFERMGHPQHTLIEPFAGGAIVSLTAVMENLVHRTIMAELDPDVAAFWKAVLNHNDELKAKVQQFVPSREVIQDLTSAVPESVLGQGFRTLVLNRTRRGGILARGAALTRSGENGKGVASRWYPETIVNRLSAISRVASRIEFQERDGLELLETGLEAGGFGTVVFADPPYTAGGKRAGSRLYNSSSIDHRRLFSILAKSDVPFLMTYDKSSEILSLIEEYGFRAVQVLMKNTHHARIIELVITRDTVFA